MMGASGEPRAYYPQDSNGLSVQSELPAPCVCSVQPQTPAVCPPLGYGSCEGGRCGELSAILYFGFPCRSARDKDLERCLKKCAGKQGEEFLECMAKCLGISKGKKYCEDRYCDLFPDHPACSKGNPCKVSNPDVVDCQHCCGIKHFCCLICNPPGTSGAVGCHKSYEKCLFECDLRSLEVPQ